MKYITKTVKTSKKIIQSLLCLCLDPKWRYSVEIIKFIFVFTLTLNQNKFILLSKTIGPGLEVIALFTFFQKPACCQYTTGNELFADSTLILPWLLK